MRLALGTYMILRNGSSSDVVFVTARVKQLGMQLGKVLEDEKEGTFQEMLDLIPCFLLRYKSFVWLPLEGKYIGLFVCLFFKQQWQSISRKDYRRKKFPFFHCQTDVLVKPTSS